MKKVILIIIVLINIATSAAIVSSNAHTMTERYEHNYKEVMSLDTKKTLAVCKGDKTQLEEVNEQLKLAEDMRHPRYASFFLFNFIVISFGEALLVFLWKMRKL